MTGTMTARTWRFVLAGLLVSLLLGGAVSYYASSAPDGLNKVAEDTGFAESETRHVAEGSPVAGYETRGVGDERLSRGLAAALGIGVCFAAGLTLTMALRRRGPAPRSDSTGAGTGTGPGPGDPARP